MILSEVERILSRIRCVGTRFEDWRFAFKVEPIPVIRAMGGPTDNDLLLRCSFERPDAETGEMGEGYGRPWFIHKYASESSIVKTAWLAMKQIVDHELMESFTYKNVVVFDPHKSINEIGRGSRKVEVHSMFMEDFDDGVTQ